MAPHSQDFGFYGGLLYLGPFPEAMSSSEPLVAPGLVVGVTGPLMVRATGGLC